MCERAHVSVAESMEKRYSIVQERVRALWAEPGAKGPGWLWESLGGLEGELNMFAPGPEGASKEERVAFFEAWLRNGTLGNEPTPEIPGVPADMLQLLRSQPQLLQQLAGGPAQAKRRATVCDAEALRTLVEEHPELKWDDRLAGLANTEVTVQQDDDTDGTSMILAADLGIRGWIPRAALSDSAPQRERLATVCASDRLRALFEKCPTLQWDERLVELGGSRVTVVEDDNAVAEDEFRTSRIRSDSTSLGSQWIPRAALRDYVVRVAPLEALRPALEAHPSLNWDERRAEMACREGVVTQVDDGDDTAKVIFPPPIAKSAWFPMATLEEVTPVLETAGPGVVHL